MIGDAISYPAESSKKNIAIGSVLTLFGILLLPLIFVVGYYVKVFERTFDGQTYPPEFSDESWGDLFVEGIVCTAIGVLYILIPFVLAIGGMTVAGAGVTFDPGAGAGIGFAVLLLTLLAYVVVSYFIPAAIMNYVYHDSFGAAFDFNELFKVTFTVPYFLAMLVVILLSFAVGIVAGIISVIPVLGWIASAVIGFYFGIVYVRIFANAYHDIVVGGGAESEDVDVNW